MPKDAPDVLIILLDDAGFDVPDTFSGFAPTPALTRLSNEGITYNRIRTASICSG